MDSAAGGSGWWRSLFARPRRQGRRTAISRLITPLALFLVAATLFCTVAIGIVIRQADARHDLDRRRALQGATAELAVGPLDVDPALLSGLEQTWGLKALRFETEPDIGARDSQPVLDQSGRILGWFTWEPDQRLSGVLSGLGPFLVILGAALFLFA